MEITTSESDFVNFFYTVNILHNGYPVFRDVNSFPAPIPDKFRLCILLLNFILKPIIRN